MSERMRRLGVGMLFGAMAVFVIGCPPTPGEEQADREAEECTDNSDCDDGVACNGVEYCSVDDDDSSRMVCYDRESTCVGETQCDVTTDTCIPL